MARPLIESPNQKRAASLVGPAGASRGMGADLWSQKINLPRTKSGKVPTVYLNEKAMGVFRSIHLDKDTLATEPVFALDVTREEVSMRFMRACRKAIEQYWSIPM